MSDADAAVHDMTQMFLRAVDAAQPAQFMAQALPLLEADFHRLARTDAGRLVIGGFGKASAAMAQAFEQVIPPALLSRTEGLIIVPDGHEVDTSMVRVVSASHPVPDGRGRDAAAEMLAQAGRLGADDLLVMLISGGGSSLCCLPAEDISLSQKQALTSALLKAGANIAEMNIVRKHLSQIKGGRLAAAAYPAKTVSIGISDVPHDDISVIASGPTVADNSSCADALALIDHYRLEIPPAIRSALNTGALESIFAGDERLSHASYHLLATPQKSLEAAAEYARSRGYEPVILGDSLEGEARELAREMADIVSQASEGKAFISGGETTVTVTGTGVGGRNVEFIHALASMLPCYGLAADTDGIDGGAEIAGAYITPMTAQKADAAGLDMAAMLDNNDSHSLFARLDQQIITGPTLTNVNDFRVILS
ncbi:MAG: glycerate kinase type-2 family protein [Candidatus Puniceispirillaceae bacterium]